MTDKINRDEHVIELAGQMKIHTYINVGKSENC
ncbi:hypothetical protein NSB1T_09260 [Coprobacter fastidiosus NSB1 = JCM 33896]|nr:hypothetical protein NSB1T_09260 [Coprobacter fastidiosus NSB1 = JCM 33896]